MKTTNIFTLLEEKVLPEHDLNIVIVKHNGRLHIQVYPSAKDGSADTEFEALQLKGTPAELDAGFLGELEKAMVPPTSGLQSNAEKVAESLKVEPVKKAPPKKKPTPPVKKAPVKPVAKPAEKKPAVKVTPKADEKATKEKVAASVKKSAEQMELIPAEPVKEEPKPTRHTDADLADFKKIIMDGITERERAKNEAKEKEAQIDQQIAEETDENKLQDLSTEQAKQRIIKLRMTKELPQWHEALARVINKTYGIAPDGTVIPVEALKANPLLTTNPA